MDTPITLVFTSSDAWISRIIRFVTRSNTSHAAIGLTLYGVPFFFHASVGGIQATPRTRWLQQNRVVAEFRIVPNVEQGLRKSLEYIGASYDYVGLVGYIFVLLGRVFGLSSKNRLASPTAMVCAEFARHLDLKGDIIPEWKQLDPEQTSPEDLLRVCEGSANFVRVRSGDL